MMCRIGFVIVGIIACVLTISSDLLCQLHVKNYQEAVEFAVATTPNHLTSLKIEYSGNTEFERGTTGTVTEFNLLRVDCGNSCQPVHFWQICADGWVVWAYMVPTKDTSRTVCGKHGWSNEKIHTEGTIGKHWRVVVTPQADWDAAHPGEKH